MLKFIKVLANGKTDVGGAIKQFKACLNNQQLRSLLEYFEQLDICPVPLDKHSKLKTICSIPNILKMMGDDSPDIRLSTKRKRCLICTE